MSKLKKLFSRKTQPEPAGIVAAAPARPAPLPFTVPLIHRESGEIREVLHFKSVGHFADILQFTYTRYTDGGCFLDLSNKDLRHLDLSETRDLRGAKFDGSLLTGTSLHSSNLTGASFARCNMRGANLYNCKITGGNFMSADLTDAKMDDADIAGADLHYAAVSNAQLAACKNAPSTTPLTAYGLAIRAGRINRAHRTV